MFISRKSFGFASYFVFLLLISAGLLAGLFSMGCECSPPSTGSSTTTTHTDTPPKNGVGLEEINHRPSYQPGDKVEVRLMGFWTPEDGTGMLEWWPPDGATAIAFPPDRQPEPGGPPFLFKNLTSEQAKAGIAVSYNAPPPPIIDGKPWRSITDHLHVEMEKTSHACQMEHACTQKTTQNSDAEPQVRPASAPTATDVTFWDVERGVDFDTELTQAACQDLVAQLKSAYAFTALRLPLADEITPGQSYELPIVQTAPHAPRLFLISSWLQEAMAQEIRPDATTWANYHLPAAPGARWVALGVKPDADVDCTGFTSLPKFTLVSLVSLDLSSRPAACAGCEIAMYVCYKSAPGAHGLASEAQPSLATADGFTCLGPGALPLIETGKWLLEPFTVMQTLKPGDPVQLHYWIENLGDAETTFSLAYSATLASPTWVIRPGLAADPLQPDMSRTISGEVRVPAHGTAHLHIFGQTPADAAVGQYHFFLQAANVAVTPPAWRGSTLLVVTADGSLPTAAPLAAAVAVGGVATPVQVSAGQAITYFLTVTNTGAFSLTNLVLTDTLPVHTAYLSCTGGDSCAANGAAIAWNLANLGTGQSRSFTLAVRIDAGLPDGAQIANTAYRITTGQGVAADGPPIVTVLGRQRKLFLPLILRQ